MRFRPRQWVLATMRMKRADVSLHCLAQTDAKTEWISQHEEQHIQVKAARTGKLKKHSLIRIAKD